jgi:hypothetical protein
VRRHSCRALATSVARRPADRADLPGFPQDSCAHAPRGDPPSNAGAGVAPFRKRKGSHEHTHVRVDRAAGVVRSRAAAAHAAPRHLGAGGRLVAGRASRLLGSVPPAAGLDPRSHAGGRARGPARPRRAAAGRAAAPLLVRRLGRRHPGQRLTPRRRAAAAPSAGRRHPSERRSRPQLSPAATGDARHRPAAGHAPAGRTRGCRRGGEGAGRRDDR